MRLELVALVHDTDEDVLELVLHGVQPTDDTDARTKLAAERLATTRLESPQLTEDEVRARLR